MIKLYKKEENNIFVKGIAKKGANSYNKNIKHHIALVGGSYAGARAIFSLLAKVDLKTFGR
jgi:hypothetical protein